MSVQLRTELEEDSLMNFSKTLSAKTSNTAENPEIFSNSELHPKQKVYNYWHD
jgi:hypothetical protein